MVSSSKDLEQVMLGDGGLLTGETSPRIIADVSTVSTEASELIRNAANSRGSDFLATPVSGNPKVIAAGKLTVAVSGPREVFESIEPVLNVFGRGVTYVGEGEVARLVKIAHNLMLGVVTQCLAEITVLVEKGGVSRADFLAFLNDSVMGSAFTQYKSPAFVNLDFAPTFTMALLQKDFDLGLEAADQLKSPMPIASATRQIVAQAAGAGRGEDEDFATLLLEVARGAGITLVPEKVAVDDGLAPVRS
jgi:3-hydroxyisobutyrate dehydrogenase-like beta-hydroxyacid dehydrogenase